MVVGPPVRPVASRHHESAPELHRASPPTRGVGPLQELAFNLRWSWDHRTRDLFRWVDPQIWELTFHDPVRLLSLVGRQRLEQLAAGPGLHGLPRRDARRPAPLPRGAPVVPEPGREPSPRRGLLLARVRHRRGPAPVLRRPRRPGRRPPQGGQQPGDPVDRRRADVPPRATSASISTPTGGRRSATRSSTRTAWPSSWSSGVRVIGRPGRRAPGGPGVAGPGRDG